MLVIIIVAIIATSKIRDFLHTSKIIDIVDTTEDNIYEAIDLELYPAFEDAKFFLLDKQTGSGRVYHTPAELLYKMNPNSPQNLNQRSNYKKII